MTTPAETPPPSRASARAFRILTAVTILGGVVVGTIGFVGSYDSLRQLGQDKGFGGFSYAFPIGVDAGIIVLLGFDLLLTRKQIPFPMLRHVAWLLTAATIWFNAHAGVPDPTPANPDPKMSDDPLSAAMHALLPVLFITLIEAARHTIRRLARLASGKAMDSIRLARWLLSPLRTFLLWRRMKLWEINSYETAVTLERDRMVYRRRTRARYGWRGAPIEVSLPLALTRYGEQLPPAPLTEGEETSEREAREAREARARDKREAKERRKAARREAREREEREAREAREAEREARERAEREAHERELARLALEKDKEREARELELARIKAESEARVNEARELARLKDADEQRKAEREAAIKAREVEEAQARAREAAETRAAQELAEQGKREAHEREMARLAAQAQARVTPVPEPGPRASQSGPRASQTGASGTREERQAQKREADREAARLIVGGSPLPTALQFGAQYGQGETWGGDRIRAARTRLANDSAFKDAIETEILEAAYSAETMHAQ